ncbi:MAG: Rrf2 family transcriptional regulator [Saprospiraceae bacterium]|uniref:Rrf2 family transcriptional regulator n=1 Tax=Candidatus Brachybacter algidus TaxID=2982024 RepID=UPI00338EC6D6|nr:Rrf2 family transcriptional regulator [Candidatus Brachybacter algidus]
MIAEAIDSPKSFTAKIMQSLTKNNCVISSMRGPNGGFYITESAKKLPVRAVLKAMGEKVDAG